MTNALRQLKAVAEEIKPEAGVAHRRLPGAVSLSAALWAVLAMVALWSGVDVFGSGRPETAGLSSGDISPSAAASAGISTSSLLSLIFGLLVLVGVGLLLLGLPFAPYVLYVSATVTVITLAVDSPIMAVAAMALLVTASAVLLGRSAREFLAPQSKKELFAEQRPDDTITQWLEPAASARTRPSPPATGRTPQVAPSEVVAVVAPVRRRPSPRPRTDV